MKIELRNAVALQKAFIVCSCIILLLTVFAKFFSINSSLKLLDYSDPIFGLPNRILMLIAACFEAVVILFCFLPFETKLKCALVGFSGSVFLAYRLGLFVVGFEGWCACLGNFGAPLFFDPALQSYSLSLVAAIMCVGGIVLSKAQAQ